MGQMVAKGKILFLATEEPNIMAARAGLLQSQFEEAARGPSGRSVVSNAAQVESRAVRERRQVRLHP